jgi:altronate hydrolase/galactarate dehydratase
VNPVIVISERDNVATALEALETGQVIDGTVSFTVREPIPRGHKVSRRAIAAGDSVVKYGNAIGVATRDIPTGAHVHTHNVASTRGRGDLSRTEAADEPRIAEPPGDRGNP